MNMKCPSFQASNLTSEPNPHFSPAIFLQILTTRSAEKTHIRADRPLKSSFRAPVKHYTVFNTKSSNFSLLSSVSRFGSDMTHACYIKVSKALSFRALASSRLSNLFFNLSCKSTVRRIRMENSQSSPICSNNESRGALIVLEGLDRSGKTSQCSRLLSHLEGLGRPAELWRFPDRNTSVGQTISSYLSNKSQLDDRTIHLLFSANRWEKRSLMETKLKSGTTLIVDRYSYSGVAFSSAKGLDFEWCKAPETGLLAPDMIVYLDISPEKAAERGGYGGERYEQLEFQKKVAQHYQLLQDSSWKNVDASLPEEDVEKQLKEMTLECVMACENGKPLAKLWSD